MGIESQSNIAVLTLKKDERKLLKVLHLIKIVI